MRFEEWKQRNGTMVCHAIYSREEADTKGVEYKQDWREGELGDWVLTDDNCVVEVLRCGKDRAGRKWIGTCTMTTSTAKTTTLDTAPRDNRYSFSGKGRQLPKNLTVELMDFCKRVASGEDPEEAYKQTVGKRSNGGYSPQYKRYVRNRVRNLMNHPPVRNQIKSEIQDLLTEAGVDKIWIVRRMKEIAAQGENYSAAMSAVNKLSDLAGIRDDDNGPALPPGIGNDELGEYAEAEHSIAEDAEDVEPEDVPEESARDKLYSGLIEGGKD